MLLKHPELPWYYIKNIKELEKSGEWFILNNAILKEPGFELSNQIVCKVINYYKHINVHNPLIEEAQMIYVLAKRWSKTDKGIEEHTVVATLIPQKKYFITEYNQFVLDEILNNDSNKT